MLPEIRNAVEVLVRSVSLTLSRRLGFVTFVDLVFKLTIGWLLRVSDFFRNGLSRHRKFCICIYGQKTQRFCFRLGIPAVWLVLFMKGHSVIAMCYSPRCGIWCSERLLLAGFMKKNSYILDYFYPTNVQVGRLH